MPEPSWNSAPTPGIRSYFVVLESGIRAAIVAEIDRSLLISRVIILHNTVLDRAFEDGPMNAFFVLPPPSSIAPKVQVILSPVWGVTVWLENVPERQ